MPAEDPSSETSFSDAGKVVDPQGQESSQRSAIAAVKRHAGKVVDLQRQESSQQWREMAALGHRQDAVFGVEQLRHLGLSDR
ncbi:MAG: hypothetical protein ACRDK8_00020, partial [Solirubrobacteraceae bacterium]